MMRLLGLFQQPGPFPQSMERGKIAMMDISGKRRATPEEEQQQEEEGSAPLLKQPAPEGPQALPVHLRAVGEYQRLAGSETWIGSARAAYEEVEHIQGIVFYTRIRHFFLTQEEAAHAQALLPDLLKPRNGEGAP